MKNYKKLLILLLVILGITGIFIFVRHKVGTIPVQKETVQELKTTLFVNIDSKIESFNISNFVGKTALEATSINTKVVTNGSGINAFVTSIDGRAANSKKREFWEFNVNGTQAQVGAGSYVVQKGDSISWRITTY
jgi:hypothetical protein